MKWEKDNVNGRSVLKMLEDLNKNHWKMLLKVFLQAIVKYII